MPQAESDEVQETSAVDGQVIMPFYLIVDVSSSMRRDIPELTAAVEELIEAIRKDPVVEDLVMLSIITFGGDAHTIVPLDSPSDLKPPSFSAAGSTNYSAAFTEYHNSFERDRARLKAKGMKVYRPCVFFLTDGGPTDPNYAETFRSLFRYDPATKSGNRAFPYFVPFGIRDAPESVIRELAYPNFGPIKGRWFLSRSNRIGDVLKAMAEVLGRTVISSGQSASQGLPQIVPPTPAPGMDAQFGEAEDWM